MRSRGRRQFSNISLSFLDVMSCGFGAAALLFLLLKHGIDTRQEDAETDYTAEVELLQEDIRQGEEGLVKLKNTLSALNMELVDADGMARRIQQQVNQQRSLIELLDPEEWAEKIKQLREELRTLEDEKQKLLAEKAKGENVRRFIGDGDRQYLTGLKLGGERILILLDASSSMLDETLVNVIRKRNMSSDVRRNSPKWVKAQERASWLVSQFPQESYFQIYLFNTHVKAALDDSDGDWLKVSDSVDLEQAMLTVRDHVPNGGTSLERAFLSAAQLDPLPDNIFLITDGLPTQGLNPPKGTAVSGSERLDLFKKAVNGLPEGIPINTLLSPMEGDPLAAAAYWQLAQVSGGAFLSPTEDWP